MKPTVLHFDQDLLIFITEPDASVSESGVNSHRSSRIASPCINRPRNIIFVDLERKNEFHDSIATHKLRLRPSRASPIWKWQFSEKTIFQKKFFAKKSPREIFQSHQKSKFSNQKCLLKSVILTKFTLHIKISIFPNIIDLHI